MTARHSHRNNAEAGPRDSYARRLQRALIEARQRRVVACEPVPEDAHPVQPAGPNPVDPELAYMTRAWPSLPRAVRDALLAVVRGCEDGRQAS
jgi:hypothetical protein